MARPWVRRIIRVAGVIVVIAALAVPWVFPAATTAVVMKTARAIPPLSLPLIVLLAVEATLVLAAAIWWLWWRLPKRQVHGLDIQIHDAKARADTEDNFRKTAGQALGGAAVLIGAGAAYLQFTQQQQTARDLLISNQVSKGFEQLASDKIAMRLGGLYALEGVMNTSLDYHLPVLEALCAFVREGTVGMIVDATGATTDIQAALTVIGRRKAGAGRVYLAGAKIPGVTLADADLRRAFLNHADLRRVNFVRADLSYGFLYYVNLRDAFLRNAVLRGAMLLEADLTGTDLTGADLTDANLRGADLTRADLGDAQGLTQVQLDKACGKPASLPPGLILDKPCPPPP